VPPVALKVTLYVQHLLGTGHLVRIQHLALALHQIGHAVTLISGGNAEAEQDYRVIQLPALRVRPGDFLTLLDIQGIAVDASWKASRAEKLIDAVRQSRPDVVVVETWPFGRRQMEFEIIPMLESLSGLQRLPMIVCSIRDVLQIRRPQRRQETLENLKKYCSLVVVHGEQKIISLAESFAEYDQISCPVVYSGYIGGPLGAAKGDAGIDEILVSAGGGAAGVDLMRFAAQASAASPYCWRILVGHNVEAKDFESLCNMQRPNLRVERNRKDFQRLLSNCAVSVSQFGYNTALDIIRCGCRAVVIPYTENGETEQYQRAKCFADKGLISLLDSAELTADALHKAVVTALQREPAGNPDVNLDGAATSARLIEQYYCKLNP